MFSVLTYVNIEYAVCTSLKPNNSVSVIKLVLSRSDLWVHLQRLPT